MHMEVSPLEKWSKQRYFRQHAIRGFLATDVPPMFGKQQSKYVIGFWTCQSRSIMIRVSSFPHVCRNRSVWWVAQLLQANVWSLKKSFAFRKVWPDTHTHICTLTNTLLRTRTIRFARTEPAVLLNTYYEQLLVDFFFYYYFIIIICIIIFCDKLVNFYVLGWLLYQRIFNTFRSLPYPCSKLCHTVYYFHILFPYLKLYSNILFTTTAWVE